MVVGPYRSLNLAQSPGLFTPQHCRFVCVWSQVCSRAVFLVSSYLDSESMSGSFSASSPWVIAMMVPTTIRINKPSTTTKYTVSIHLISL